MTGRPCFARYKKVELLLKWAEYRTDRAGVKADEL